GLVRVWFAARDLRRPHVVVGEVVKVLDSGRWFAVDPGHVDHVKAWHPGALAVPPRSATVRVTVTPHLGHVTAIDVTPSVQWASTQTAPPATAGGSPSGPVHPAPDQGTAPAG